MADVSCDVSGIATANEARKRSRIILTPKARDARDEVNVKIQAAQEKRKAAAAALDEGRANSAENIEELNSCSGDDARGKKKR